MQDRLTYPVSLRERLREDLQAVHDALDQKISTLDLTDRGEYRAFLAMTHMALSGIEAEGGDATGLLDEMVRALAEDLEALGDPASAPLAPVRVHPLALDYVLIGSRLGTQVLRKRWLAGADPQVKAADAYFSLPAQGAAWRALTDALGTMSGADRQAAEVVADARALFQRFSASLELCRTSLSPVLEPKRHGPHVPA